MSTAAQIDFQLYMGLLAAELPRFSVPGIGSFIWHVERVQVDPKSGTVTPPRPSLKYEPGHKYLGETIAFLRDYYGLSEKEAEELLREIGRLTAAYLRAAPEMDLWRLGKLKRTGALYKVELQEGASIPFVADLAEISLRAGVSPVVTLPQGAAVSSEAPKKQTERPRAQPVEAPAPPVSPQPRPARRWLPIGVGILAVIVVLGALTYVITRKRTPPQPVEINLSTKPAPPPKAEPPKPSNEPAVPPKPKSTESAEAPKSSPAPASSPSPKVSPPPETPPKSPANTGKPSAEPRYYVIVGAYPSRREAEAKAAAFSGYTVEYLPHPSKAGWVRISIFSSSSRQQAEAFLRKIKAEVPDAWVYAAP